LNSRRRSSLFEMDFRETLLSLVEKVVKENFSVQVSISLQKPPKKEFGDFSTNIAMQIASLRKEEPQEVGREIIHKLKQRIREDEQIKDKVKEIKLAPPGFINFFLHQDSLLDVLEEIKREGKDYGSSKAKKGKKINIEFVSANPTGPLTIAHGRQAAFGDALANILKEQGYEVFREYYVNDEGTQIDLLGESVRACYLHLLGEKASFSEEGYKGDYIKAIAQQIFAQEGKSKKEEDKDFFARFALDSILQEIKDDLKRFGVNFDLYFSQRSLTREKIEKAIETLDKKGYILRKEGAIFFKSKEFGDDKDRVLVRSDGRITYFGWDIAYHQDKYSRGFAKLINLWGPDHHGYLKRLKGAIEALGYPKETLSIIIVQLVSLYRGKDKIPISTRAGKFITLRQVIEEIGKDATRFFFLSRRSDSHLDFDLQLAKKKSLENPVYYIQYACARICNILEFAKKEYKQINISSISLKDKESSLLNKKEEIELIKKLSEFPSILSLCAQKLEVHPLTTYLYELSSLLHSFYNQHRVVTENREITYARLLLVYCTKLVIEKGLGVLGISAPTRM